MANCPSLICVHVDALIHFNLAPLTTRRDMSILGVIHRTVLGLGPPCFKDCFTLDASPPPPRAPRRHRRYLLDPCPPRAPDYLLRSALGGVRIYNLLPESIVNAADVHDFQRILSELVRFASPRYSSWPELLSWRVPLAFHDLRNFDAWRPSA